MAVFLQLPPINPIDCPLLLASQGSAKETRWKKYVPETGMSKTAGRLHYQAPCTLIPPRAAYYMTTTAMRKICALCLPFVVLSHVMLWLTGDRCACISFCVQNSICAQCCVVGIMLTYDKHFYHKCSILDKNNPCSIVYLTT